MIGNRSTAIVAFCATVSLGAWDAAAQDCETSFDSTFEAIQSVIFEGRGCTSVACHTGANPAGDLDLSSAEVSYANLVDQPVQSIPIDDRPTLKRVLPNAQVGGKADSLLWLNVAAATIPELWEAPLRPMPLGGLPPLSLDDLQLLQLWLENGAPFDAVVPGTDRLVDACLPEPRPIKAPPLEPPAPEDGVQILSPLQVLPANSERETCFVSYYDFTGKVPEESLGEGGETFRIRRVVPRQDPFSHHAVVQVYKGDTPIDSPVWGPFACRSGDKDGQTCDPLDLDFCGDGSVCGSQPVQSVGCFGFGPGDAGIGVGTESIFNTMASGSATQEGVYDELPIKGIVVWNSHAFNVFNEEARLEIWINLEFASLEEQQHELERFVDVSEISKMNPPAYGADQVCHRFRLPDGAHVLDLSSHTHKRGSRFRIFEGAFTCDGGPRDGDPCTPFGPEPDFPVDDLCAGFACTAPLPPGIGDCDGNFTVEIAELLRGVNMLLGVDGGAGCTAFDGNGDGVNVADMVRAVGYALAGLQMRDAEESLIYTTLSYADPLVLQFQPSRLFAPVGSPATHRTLTYCALYDNGFTDPEEVKRSSETPTNGGRCRPTHCAEGLVRSPCSSDSQCDSSPGFGDGFCDACTAGFGVTTEDEMFVLSGSYFLE